MSDPERPRPAELPSCPLLGLPDDPVTRFSYPSIAHRCRATDRPRPIDLAHQGAFCLAATYPDCPRYLAAAAARGSGTPAARGSGTPAARGSGTPAAKGAVNSASPPTETSTVAGSPGTPDRPVMPWTLDRAARPVPPDAIAPPAPTDRPRTAGEEMRWRRPVVVAVAIAILVLLIAAAYLASPAIADWLRHPGTAVSAASPTPLASRSVTPAPSLVTPTPDPSPSPAGPSPDPSLRTGPTTGPTPAPTPRIHVVARGQYLIEIAAQYGVPVEAIIRANGLKDPGLIYVGERLIIPPS